MAEEAVLDVVGLEGFAEERVAFQIDHAEGEVFAGAPVGINAAEFVRSQGGWSLRDGGPGRAVSSEGCWVRHRFVVVLPP